MTAFTLIELLVLVVLVALLIALLMPTLRSARETTWSAQCLSNQRQVALGLIAYSRDNKGYTPWMPTNNAHKYQYNEGWNGKLAILGYLTVNVYGQTTSGLLPAAGVTFCATEPNRESIYSVSSFQQSQWAALPGDTWRFDWAGTHFGINLWLYDYGRWVGQEHVRFSTVRRPDFLYMLSDYSGHGHRYMFHNKDPNFIAPVEMRFRHPGRSTNIAFADGHAVNTRFEKAMVIGSPAFAANINELRDLHWKGR
jgi:prepilin-type processing-associated H-X9-DG protein